MLSAVNSTWEYVCWTNLSTVDALADKLRNTEPAARQMFDRVEQLVQMLLTVPCSNAESERSFSALRSLNTYLYREQYVLIAFESFKRFSRPSGLARQCKRLTDWVYIK